MTINGTPDNDTLPGTAANDTINGLDGNDSLLGFDGRDSLVGGNGSDTADAGNGSDTLIGGAGNDVLVGGNGDDAFDSISAGTDTCIGGDGRDTVSGGVGSDLLDGGAGVDFIDYRSVAAGGVNLDLATGIAVYAGGTDTLVSIEDGNGTNVNDTVFGSVLAGSFFGGTGDDILDGRAGSDFLNGDSGNDTLIGGLGNDILDGGSGRDRVLFSDREMADLVIEIGIDYNEQRLPFANLAGAVEASGETDTLRQVEELVFPDGTYTPAVLLQATNGFLKEGSAGQQSMEFTLSLTGVVDHEVTLSATTTGGSATSGVDFTAVNQQIVFPAFTRQAIFSVPIVGDADVEGLETFSVTLSDLQGARFAGDGTQLVRTGYILTDEGGVTPTDDFANDTTSGATLGVGASLFGSIEVNGDHDFLRADLTAGQEYHIAVEGAPTSKGSNQDVFLRVRDAGGTELAVDDDGGQGRNSFLSFTPQSSGVHFLDVSGFGESNTGTYQVRLDLATALPELSVEDFSIIEGTGGGLVARVNIRSSRVFDESITVVATPVAGTAQAGSDFDPTARTATIFTGDTVGFVEIPIIADGVLEADEVFSIVLSNPTKAVLSADPDGIVQIVNDDDAARVTIAGAEVAEGNGGQGAALFTVGLEGTVQATPLLVNFQVFSGSAIAGTDFTNIAAGTVTIPAGQSTATLPVFALGDTVFEGDQVLYAALNSVTGSATAALGSPLTARATILDDDAVPTVAVNGIVSVGGGGVDILSGGPLRDSLVGGEGNDVLLAGAEGDRLEGGGGGDFLIADLLLSDLGATTGGADAIIGGAGKDSVLAGAANDTVSGDGDDDLLVGQGGRDLLVGGEGSDALYGGNDADSLKGDAGDDFLFGESAPDTMDGGSGNDRLHVDIDDFLADGNAGNFDAVVITGPGTWVIDLGNEANQNVGGVGPRLLGFEVVDAAVASSAVDMTGFAFNGGGNVLYGSAFNDTITGSSAVDIILGGDGGDVIDGGAGGDSIGSEQGNDTLTGGIGNDAFIYFGIGGGETVITDFEPDRDDLWLPVTKALDPATALSLATQVGLDTVLIFADADGGRITLTGVPLSALDTDDFQILPG